MIIEINRDESKIVLSALFSETRRRLNLMTENRDFPEAKAYWRGESDKCEDLRFKIEQQLQEQRKEE